MAQLIVRNIDVRVVQALKKRAAARGHSTEAEHRALLEEVLLKSRPDFKAFLLSMPAVSFRRTRSKPRKLAL